MHVCDNIIRACPATVLICVCPSLYNVVNASFVCMDKVAGVWLSWLGLFEVLLAMECCTATDPQILCPRYSINKNNKHLNKTDTNHEEYIS